MMFHRNQLPHLIFAILGVVWGSNFIYMKMAAALITPGQIVLFRVLFGFIPVIIYAGVRRSLHLCHLRHWPHFLVMSVLATAFYYYIVETMGAVAASSVTYLPPVVALFIGFLLVGEPIELMDFLATGMIFVGVFLLKQ